MKNEKGLTLIELLAAITISSILLGVSYSLFSSMAQVAQNSSQQFADNSSINKTMDTIARQVSISSQIVYHSSNNELRYKMGKLYKSILYSASANTLTLYDFSNDGNTSNDDSHFKSGSINKTANSNLYTNAMVLSTNISKVSYIKSDGTTAIASTPLTDGEQFTVTISFVTNLIKINGGTSTKTVDRSATLKLLDDFTSK
jgi:prepilin-type N-terminal cleavage/methylation domain-containing protein